MGSHIEIKAKNLQYSDMEQVKSNAYHYFIEALKIRVNNTQSINLKELLEEVELKGTEEETNLKNIFEDAFYNITETILEDPKDLI